ncbi:MAG: DUF3847 domain-containing protein [Oscillospiraceae bacterium]|jgi:hypothetical protein|nr:DUF3847 domain-containing protein [Oscillospiraceae bacterium]
MNKELDRLRKEQDKAQKQLRKAQNDEKSLRHELSRLNRTERTRRLCVRAGMLETFLKEPLLLTDDDVMELLRFIFQGETVQKKLNSLIENRRKSQEIGTV